MKTTELFDFHFVDRYNEQKVLKNFLSDPMEYVLWIKGERGLGKTEFLNYVLKSCKEYELCYVDLKINNSSVDNISNFIVELQKHCNIDFMMFIKKKYKYFYDSNFKNFKELSSQFFPQISNVVSAILNLGYYVVTIFDEKKSPSELINDYIELIIKKKKLFICVDNFSRCDIETARLFNQVFKRFISEQNFKSCIITTSEDLANELKEEIHCNLPFIPIEIHGFSGFDYFYQIMNPIFEMEDFTKEDLEYIFNKCEGSPKKLATVISKLLEKNGIFLSSYKKAYIDKKILFSILQMDHIKFKEQDFTSEQKWIIFSYLCLTESVSYSQLKSLALYISEKFFLYQAYDEHLFTKELMHLIDNRILACSSDSMISTCHDLDYMELRDILAESPFKGIFSQKTYEFLMLHPEYPSHEKLLCYHAREAEITGWEIRNFRYGKKLFHNGQIYDAQGIFSCLGKYFNRLHPMQILLIALTSYETGNYQLAIQQFSLIQPEQLRFEKVQYYYYFYYGKSYNNIGESKQAAEMLEEALRKVPEHSALYVYTLNVLHMYYYEIPEKQEQAEKIFNYIRAEYKDIYPKIWANTMRGCQNFLDNETSLKVLQEADSILDDELEKAFLKTTKGFVLIKLDCIEKAEKEFSVACKTIKQLKIHEYSYAANNLAICYMMRGDYAKAYEILLDALLWNRTRYADLVLQTHLMMCALNLSQQADADYYYKFLENYMETHRVQDPIANRKIYMNLAMASHKMGKNIAENAYYRKAQPFVKNSTSEWRYKVLTHSVKELEIDRPMAQYQQILNFEPWFLIYAHD